MGNTVLIVKQSVLNCIKYTDQLLAEGKAYYCYCTDEELEAERQALSAKGQMPRYMGKCRNLTSEQIEQYKAEGRKPTVRFRVPADQQILVRDMVRGDVVFDSNGIGDFVIVNLTAFLLIIML